MTVQIVAHGPIIVNHSPTPNRWVGALPFVRYRVAHTSEGLNSLPWLMNPNAQVSYTFYVPRVGPKVYRVVPEGDAAWHAGRVCQPITTPLYSGMNPNREAEGIGFEGFASEPLTDFQIEAWKVLNTVAKPWCSHANLAGCNRTDPGAGNMALLVAALAEEDDVGLTQEERNWLWEAKETGHQAKNAAEETLRIVRGHFKDVPPLTTPLRASGPEQSERGEWIGPGPAPLPKPTATRKKRR